MGDLTPQRVAVEIGRSMSVTYALLRERRDLTVVNGKRRYVPESALPVLKALVEERAGNVSERAPIETAVPVLQMLFRVQDAKGISNKKLERRISRGRNLRGMVKRWRSGEAVPGLWMLMEIAEALGHCLTVEPL